MKWAAICSYYSSPNKW